MEEWLQGAVYADKETIPIQLLDLPLRVSYACYFGHTVTFAKYYNTRPVRLYFLQTFTPGPHTRSVDLLQNHTSNFMSVMLMRLV
jgi:hypothetical protein